MNQEIVKVTEWRSNSIPYTNSKGFEDLRVCFRIEYIDNANDWKGFEKADLKGSTTDPWEWYKVRIYDDPGLAMQIYTEFLIRCHLPETDFNKMYDVKMWMQVYKADEIISGCYVEPESTYKYEMSRLLNREMRERISEQNRQIKKLSQAVEKYERCTEMIPSLR
jgi:hypothetical protein